MKIYTRAGDGGQTELPGGVPVAKDIARLEAVGSVDELNALLGLARSEALPKGVDRLLQRLQHELFELAAELAVAVPAAHDNRTLGLAHVRALEEAIDRYSERLKPLGEFILPGGSRAAAALHVARTVCRRAERRLVTLIRQDEPESMPNLTAYLNRLSDLLFVLARAVNALADHDETRWRKGSV